MVKYRIVRDENKGLVVDLTGVGRLREFFGGVAVALPWSTLGVAVFFLPDYLGKYRHEPELLPVFWGYLGVLLSVVVLWYALRRAFKPVRWVVADGMIREHTRGLLGGEEIGVEAPARAVESLERLGTVLRLRTAGGGEHVVARAWVGREELAQVEAALKEAIVRTGR